MGGEGGALTGGHAGEAAVGIEEPALLVVFQVGDHDLVDDLVVNGGVFHGDHDLDAVVEIARHPVRRTDKNFRFVGGQFKAVAEAINARMF